MQTETTATRSAKRTATKATAPKKPARARATRVKGKAARTVRAPRVAKPVSTPITPAQQSENITRRTICLDINMRGPVFQKKIQASDIIQQGTEESPGADPSLIHVAKEIIDQNELRTIRSLDRQFKNWLALKVIPGTKFLRGGLHLLPIELFDDIYARLQEFIIERGRLVAEFGEKYLSLQTAARLRLGPHFDVNDYPPLAKILVAFRVDYDLAAAESFINVPALLGVTNPAIFKLEDKRSQEKLANIADDIREALREGFGMLVGHFADRLAPDGTGKAKKFKEASILSLKEFFSTFSARNLTDDEHLQKLVTKARALLDGIDSDSLRKNEDLRTSIQGGFAKIKTAVDKLVVETKGRRKFSFA